MGIARGDWLLTCRMMPVQFNQWEYEDIDKHGRRDFFSTLDGSEHSRTHCGLKLISAEYAQWFIANEMWRYYHFFFDAKIDKHSQWFYDVVSGLWYREAKTGLRYCYTKHRKVMRFVHLEYPNQRGLFIYVPSTRRFSTKDERERWVLYGAWIRWAAQQDGLMYEGY